MRSAYEQLLPKNFFFPQNACCIKFLKTEKYNANKFVSSIDEGVCHIESIAAPANAKRLHWNTPCAKTGLCVHCHAPCLCCCTSVIRHNRFPCCLLSRTFSSCLQNVHRMAAKMTGNLLWLPACLRCHSISVVGQTCGASRTTCHKNGNISDGFVRYLCSHNILFTLLAN